MKVKFVPQNVEFEIKFNESVLHVAHNNGLHIKSVCKGVPSCAECRVQIVEGEYNVLPPSNTELSLIGSAHFIDRSRLSCQLKCFGDVTINLAEQIEKADRVVGGKRPRGGRGTEMDYSSEKSHAVRGNIILDESENTKVIEEAKTIPDNDFDRQMREDEKASTAEELKKGKK